MQRIGQRRSFVTAYAYKVAKSMMPKISGFVDSVSLWNFYWTLSMLLLATERAALNAGTVGFDKNLFSGNPTLADLKKYVPTTTAEEQGNFFFIFNKFI